MTSEIRYRLALVLVGVVLIVLDGVIDLGEAWDGAMRAVGIGFAVGGVLGLLLGRRRARRLPEGQRLDT